MINFKTVACVSLVLLFTACDPLGFLDSESKSKNGNNGAEEQNRWKCVDVFSAKKFLCVLGNQSVTVELENVIIPGCLSKAEREFFDKHISLSKKSFKQFADEAFDFSSNLLFNMDVSLFPSPKKTSAFCKTRATVIPGGDAEARLLDAGLAILKKSLAPEVKDRYINYQQKAIDYGDGFWSKSIANTNDFAIKVTVSLIPANVNKISRKKVKNLPKFHSPDLYNGPKFTMTETKSIENISNMEMKLIAEAAIKITATQKNYELTLRIRPHVIEKEFSGPLSSFKKATLNWTESTINIKGGSKSSIKTECPPVEISRVIKGNNVSVFTGAIIESCDIEILSNGKIIYQTEKQFPLETTLNKLNNTFDSAF